MFKEVLATSAVFVGSIIGAGFATGKEICVYFGEASIFAPIIAGVTLGVLCLVFMLLGRGTDDVIGDLFGCYSYPVKVLISLANFVVFSTMIAGAELIFRECFSLRGVGVVSAFVSLLFATRADRAVAFLNVVAVPIIIGVTVYFALTHDASIDGKLLIVSPISYACQNVLTGGYLVSRYSRDYKVSTCIVTSVVVALFSSMLLVAVYLVARDYASTPMPLFSHAIEIGAVVISGIMIFLAIFTTMATTLKVVTDGCLTKAIVAVIGGLLLSMVGFTDLVTFFYPIIGYVGIAFVLFSVAGLCRKLRNKGVANSK